MTYRLICTVLYGIQNNFRLPVHTVASCQGKQAAYCLATVAKDISNFFHHGLLCISVLQSS